MNIKNFVKIQEIIDEAKKFSPIVIEASLIKYISDKTGKKFFYNDELKIYKGKANDKLVSTFNEKKFLIDIEFITEFFEGLLSDDNKSENGIVFTPEYISDYIFENAYNFILNKTPYVIDPACGCGIFLVSAARCIKKNTGMPYKEIISNHIFGIELDSDNVRRCKIVLNLLPLIDGEDNQGINTNINCKDSLKCNWLDVCNVKEFDLIIGNPPYVNTHDMTKETAKFLKNTFTTTKSGVYNIFYAFIEHGLQYLNNSGMMSYIVPNNFLTIKSATELRKFIMQTKSLHLIIDFGNNLVFQPKRTYNCIIQLTKTINSSFKYAVMNEAGDIKANLNCIDFNTMNLDKLDVNGWKLVDKKTQKNLQKIEGQSISIKNFIRTGIATLRDDVYIVQKDKRGFYKNINGKKIYVENNIVKRLYKIPDLKNCSDLSSICRYIIFPYTKGNGKFEIIEEDNLKKEFPRTYKYLISQKPELDKRDKGKPNPVAWYAYGRNQGLNKYGIKLLFPTFASKPRFIYVDDEYALFCNGYAVFQNDYLDLDILQKILNSKIMEYYIKNTSYAIEGGYYCYQKKYIERFSIPKLNESEKDKIKILSGQALDEYLINMYELEL